MERRKPIKYKTLIQDKNMHENDTPCTQAPLGLSHLVALYKMAILRFPLSKIKFYTDSSSRNPTQVPPFQMQFYMDSSSGNPTQVPPFQMQFYTDSSSGNPTQVPPFHMKFYTDSSSSNPTVIRWEN